MDRLHEQDEVLRKVMGDMRPDIRRDDPYLHEWAERIAKGKTYAWVHAGPGYKRALIDAGYAPDEEEYTKQMMEWNYPLGSVSPEERQAGMMGIRREFRQQLASAQTAKKEPWTYKDSVKIVKMKPRDKKISFPDPYFPGQKYEEYDEGQE